MLKSEIKNFSKMIKSFFCPKCRLVSTRLRTPELYLQFGRTIFLFIYPLLNFLPIVIVIKAIFHASHSCLIFINLSLNRQKIPTIEKDKLILGQLKNSEVHCMAQISKFKNTLKRNNRTRQLQSLKDSVSLI